MSAGMDKQVPMFCQMRQRWNALKDERIRVEYCIDLNSQFSVKVCDQLDQILLENNCNSVALKTQEILENRCTELRLQRLDLRRLKVELQKQEALLRLDAFKKPGGKHRLRKFIKENESLCKQFGGLQTYEESINFLEIHPKLVCEEAARFLIEWGIKLEMNQQSELVKTVAHQSVYLQYILELGHHKKTSPVECVRIFYENILKYSLTYRTQFLKDIDILVKYTNLCAVHQSETLDAFEVLDSLPKDMRMCFLQQDIKSLENILLNRKSEENLQHFKRCINVGIWQLKGNNEKSDRSKAQQGSRQQHILPKVQTHPTVTVPHSEHVRITPTTNRWSCETTASLLQKQQPRVVTPNSDRNVIEESSFTSLGSDDPRWCHEAVELSVLNQQEPAVLNAKRNWAKAIKKIQQQQQTVVEIGKNKLISKCDKAVQTNPGVFFPCLINKIMEDTTSSNEHIQYSNVSKWSNQETITKGNLRSNETVLSSDESTQDFMSEVKMERPPANQYPQLYEDDS